MPVGEEGDVFFGEIKVCCEVVLELCVKWTGVSKPAVFPDFFDEGSIFLEWRERGFGDEDRGHFPCMYICVGRIWMLCGLCSTGLIEIQNTYYTTICPES